ncbi:hypothetical protein DY000_02033865 [Brassica cretica]|uniref:Uncharacterized protein n=1 Tax=Brassica cretica TaxID=69181 RepID=A0ABQ7DR78_BRACR|nr:hypothetical protein DY000_02033865 [Brassica cretica]
MGLRTVPFCSMLLINQTELSWPFIIGPKCISLMGIEEEMVEMLQIGGSDRAKELEEMWLRIGVHADDDDERDEAVVSRDFGLLQRPIGPFLEELQLGIGGSSRRSFPFSFERFHGFRS